MLKKDALKESQKYHMQEPKLCGVWQRLSFIDFYRNRRDFVILFCYHVFSYASIFKRCTNQLGIMKQLEENLCQRRCLLQQVAASFSTDHPNVTTPLERLREGGCNPSHNPRSTSNVRWNQPLNPKVERLWGMYVSWRLISMECDLNRWRVYIRFSRNVVQALWDVKVELK